MSIAVVIPAYNAASFIGETLDSVLRQTLPATEIIVVDDGSTDDTSEVAEAFGSRVRVIKRTNCGQSSARNFGVKQATSEWVAFIDADDLWNLDKLDRQMRQLSRNPNADICYCGLVEFHVAMGNIILGRVALGPPEEDVVEALHRNTSFLPSSVVIRRSTFLAFGGFDESMSYVEDWDLWLRMLHAGVRFTGCSEPLLQYRIHNSSMSHNALLSLAAQKQVFRANVFPYLPRKTRWITLMRSQSGQEEVASLILRRSGQPGYLRMMMLAIIRYPCYRPHRYKVLAHMLYARLRQMIRR